MITKKPVILESDGILGQLPNGGIINAGGTSNLTWTVDGKGLLFDDGSSSAPGGGLGGGLTLQKAYNASPSPATIKLTTGKDFVIADDTDDGLFFKVDSETGKVTITGDLEVLGSSTVIDTVIQDSDHWLISPKAGTTTALRIEPNAGVVPLADLVSIRRTFGSIPVFRIDSNGNLIATQNLTVGGLINGINLSQLKLDLDAHLAGDAFKHMAEDIDIFPIASLPGSTNVQAALEALNTKVDAGGGSGGGGTGDVRGYEHIQSSASLLWTINHNKSSFRATTTIYDSNWEVILPESIKIIDNNTVLVSFLSPIAGRAMVLVF